MRQKIKLSTEAYLLWHEFAKRQEAELRDGGKLDGCKEWGAKLPGNVARIAGNFHTVKVHDDSTKIELSAETMREAITVGECLIEHALATFELMGQDPAIEGAKSVLRWIVRRKSSEFTFRDCHARLQSKFPKKEDLEPAIEVLIERNYIRERTTVDQGPRSGRPSRWFDVNPELFSGGAT